MTEPVIETNTGEDTGAAPPAPPQPEPSTQPTLATWEAAAAKEVKGADLIWATPEGIDVKPLYTAADAPAPDSAGFPGLAPFARGRTPGGTRQDGWDVRQRVDAAAGSDLAVTELEKGATSVWLDLGGVSSLRVPAPKR